MLLCLIWFVIVPILGFLFDRFCAFLSVDGQGLLELFLNSGLLAKLRFHSFALIGCC